MSDDERLVRAFDRLVSRATRRLRLFAFTGAKLVRQLVDGSFEIHPDDPELPRDTRVAYLVGLPGFKVKTPKGARGAFVYLQGDPALSPSPTVVGFEAGGAVTEVAFDGGTRPIARVDDTVQCGYLIVTSAGQIAGYIPPSPGAVALAAAAVIAAGGGAYSIALGGVISTGIAKLLG